MNLSVEEWFDEIDNALEYRRIYGFEDSWTKLEMNYLNDPQSDTVIGANLIFSEGDTLLSSLIVPHPYYVVNPDDPAGVETAPVVESLENALAKPHKLNMKRQVERANLHNYLYGKGILKIGYDSEFGWNPKWDVGTLRAPWGLSYSQFDKKGKRIEFANVKPGMPWVLPVLAHDFLVPWGTGPDVDSAPWVAHRIVRATEYIKKDAKFKNTSSLKPQLSMDDYMKSYTVGPRQQRDRNQRLGRHKANGRMLFNELWEIHTKDDNKVRIICFTHDKFLRNEMDFLQMAIGGYPFVADSFIWHPRSFWTTPQAYYLGQHQHEQFDLSKQIHKQRRINVAKFLMLGDAISDDELTKLISGDVGAVAKAKTNSGKSIRDVFMAFPRTSNFDLMAESEIIRRNARDAIGQSRNQGGEFDASSRRTAREAMLVARGSATRMQRREDVVKHLYTEAMRKVIMILFRFWTTPRDVLIGEDWVKFNGAQMRGSYEFSVDLVNEPPLSPTQRKMEAIQMTAFFSQFPNLDIEKVERHIIAAIGDPRYRGFFKGLEQTPNLGSQMPPGGASSQTGEGRPVVGPGAGFGAGASQ